VISESQNIIVAGQKSQFTGDCGRSSGHVPMTSPAAKSPASVINRPGDVMLPPPSQQSTSAFYGQYIALICTTLCYCENLYKWSNLLAELSLPFVKRTELCSRNFSGVTTHQLWKKIRHDHLNVFFCRNLGVLRIEFALGSANLILLPSDKV